MPKILTYPLVPLRQVLEITKPIFQAGGTLHKVECAKKLGKSISGPFQNIISAAVKYGLLTNKKGVLTTTPLLHQIYMTNAESEKQNCLQEAFFSVDLFYQIYTIYREKKWDKNGFLKHITKHYGIPEKSTLKFSKVFSENIITCGLKITEPQIEHKNPSQFMLNPKYKAKDKPNKPTTKTPKSYLALLKGPGISFSLNIESQSDFEIFKNVLEKVEQSNSF